MPRQPVLRPEMRAAPDALLGAQLDDLDASRASAAGQGAGARARALAAQSAPDIRPPRTGRPGIRTESSGCCAADLTYGGHRQHHGRPVGIPSFCTAIISLFMDLR